MKKTLFILGLLLSIAFLYAQTTQSTAGIKKSVQLTAQVMDLPTLEIESAEALACPAAKGLNVVFGEDCLSATLKWLPPTEVLWNNVVGTTNTGYPSMRWMMEDPNRTRYTVADDFLVPAGETWYITEVYFGGFYKTAEPHEYNKPHSLGVGIYYDGGFDLPGDKIYETTQLQPLGNNYGALLTVLLPEAIVLSEGKYWVSYYGVYNDIKDDENKYYVYAMETAIGSNWCIMDESESSEWQEVNASNPSLYFKVQGKKTDAPILFNVYRNDGTGAQLIAENITVPTYTDTEFDYTKTNTWTVKVQCDGEESAALNLNRPCTFVGVNDNISTSFTIAPNPATSAIKITAESYINTVDVINFLGQTVISTTNSGKEVQFDVSSLNNGVYFVRVTTENGTSVQKFVKQ